MATARAVAEKFFERFGVGDLDGAFALFSPECTSLTPSGPLNNEKHHAAALALKRALPDSWMISCAWSSWVTRSTSPAGSRAFRR